MVGSNDIILPLIPLKFPKQSQIVMLKVRYKRTFHLSYLNTLVLPYTAAHFPNIPGIESLGDEMAKHPPQKQLSCLLGSAILRHSAWLFI